MQKIKFNKFIKVIATLFSLVLALFLLVLLDTKTFADTTTQKLRENVIRFHVLANSNSSEDQRIKEQIRDEIIRYIQPILQHIDSIEQSRITILTHMDRMQALAEEVIKQNNRTDPITIELGISKFPTKTYGDILFPAGQYEACRILIGQAEGNNWWCVLFPPLCYVDLATGVESNSELLSDAQYDIIKFQDKKTFQIRFKLWECLKGVFD
ncbi:MAG: stage II sporulation protein R [Candidatus Epulonipiscioides saccharophilum]|nr:MAG: stage II sporulation protein R [Epulopiscium sp. AS2M-Bin001]